MKKLYKCEVTLIYDVVFEAENKKEAAQVVRDYAKDELKDNYLFYLDQCTDFGVALPILQDTDIPEGWGEAIPWGQTGKEETCMEILRGDVDDVR